jgi:hypothetical protein
MIWFTCRKCGKRHKQPDEAAGSLIFCECGQANRVPWENTAPPPQEPAGDEQRPRRRRWSEAEEDKREPAPRRRRRREPRPRDPAHCLNHEEAPSEHTCADCGEAFCARCVVEFEGLWLCGPCKNFRVRRLLRPPRVAGLAVGALVAGLISAPLTFCITLTTIGSHEPGAILAGALVGTALGATALVLGLAGMRQAEGAARGGQGIAMTGAALGTAGLLWSLSLVVLMANRMLEG